MKSLKHDNNDIKTLFYSCQKGHNYLTTFLTCSKPILLNLFQDKMQRNIKTYLTNSHTVKQSNNHKLV